MDDNVLIAYALPQALFAFSIGTIIFEKENQNNYMKFIGVLNIGYFLLCWVGIILVLIHKLSPT